MARRGAVIYTVWIRHLDGSRQVSRFFHTKLAATRWARFVGGTLPVAYRGVEITKETTHA
jgi:hypothetical protein